MAGVRGAERLDADGGVRPRRHAGRRGERDPRPLPLSKLVLYVGRDCHLCERAREDLAALGYEADEVDITGDPELERRYREWIPVLELDGERLSVYRIEPDLLAQRKDVLRRSC